ncbi:MexA family multidrug efflux RND transporter periplasmic adaptor subunit [Ectopseudomonas mendocina]|jgi:membrane fusion protein (multidrug efflux system)|uniref:MexA family multidrug efflux RND transporter periplasmic adaptor subunit n=2 Tax=Ectopseudomonas mendocina TaxID=300 RepID=A0A379IQQ1_ECTME|nr:efflux RND transporter periplasmic adaptor subunit [Pseudomonas mendocina]ALN17945.1 antibiotic transporter [Pseudomonas mendocina S5.2]KES01230.1 antibiotic transporter [Pseudomonas mendocina]MDF2076693.1 efflux RND transporter periplasmic adaptor subunit [Pseudomonas mendocina]QTN47016.1 efflux RND transporter periplasmic adaptor subunit [Pseudomonas mendocina]TRO12462.1 MexA family multidrug efflux RND transporter periplasmic adaptor subunit [Pseudomonas mendocina]
MHSKPAFAVLVSAIAVAMLGLTGCQESSAPETQQTPQVGVVTLEAKPFALTSEVPGRTSAYRIAEVRPQVNGIIQKRLFTEGSEVKAGQQLYQIDPATYEAAYKSAQATQLSAKSLADRYKLLVSDKAVSQQAYDEARAASLQADAALEQARIDLRYTKVMAPISGRIGRSAVTEGALVSNGQANAMATIQQLDPIYVDVTQSSKELLRLRRDLAEGRLQKASESAAKVALKLEDGSRYAHEGTLEFSEVAVDESTGSVTLRAVFPNPDHLLLPGMFVHAELLSGVKQNAILAPQQGVTRNQRGEPTAMVVNAENKVEQRVLKADRTAGSAWLVEDGLKEGDRLITEGLQFVQPGAEVKAVPATNVKTEQPAQDAEQANGQD